MEIKEKGIAIEIDGKEIILSTEEALQLKDILDKYVSKEQDNLDVENPVIREYPIPVYPIPMYPVYPVYSPYRITSSNSSEAIL